MTTDEFIRNVQTDPYAALIQRMYADAWATGYEAARRDVRGNVDAEDRLRSDDGSQLRNRAMRELFDREQQRAEAAMIVALTALGPLVAPEGTSRAD